MVLEVLKTYLQTSVLFSVWCCVLFTGCDDQFETYPITGTVKFPDGSPLSLGQIYFETRDKRYGLGVSAMGRIHEDGSFTVGTYQRDQGGAPPATYVVYVRGAKQGGRVGTSVNERSSGEWIIHRRHRSAATSDLRAEITTEGPNHFDLIVERPE